MKSKKDIHFVLYIVVNTG